MVCGRRERTALWWEVMMLVREPGTRSPAAGFPLWTCHGLTWKRPVVWAGAAGPGTSEPLGVVVHPTTGLLGEIKVAVESRRELQIFV